jgi:hypothetical protein
MLHAALNTKQWSPCICTIYLQVVAKPAGTVGHLAHGACFAHVSSMHYHIRRLSKLGETLAGVLFLQGGMIRSTP